MVRRDLSIKENKLHFSTVFDKNISIFVRIISNLFNNMLMVLFVEIVSMIALSNKLNLSTKSLSTEKLLRNSKTHEN